MSRGQRQREPSSVELEPGGVLRLLEAALAYSADGVLVVDALGRLVFVNEAAQRLAQRRVRPGISIEELAAEFRLRYADGRPVLPEAVPLKRALQGESSVDTPLVIGKPDGTDVYISGTESPVRDEQGNVVGALCLYRDVTDRKKAEDALRQAYEGLEDRVRERTAQLARANEALRAEVASRQRAEEVLRESERRYRELADSLPQTVFEMDVEGRLTFANRSAFRAFGYTDRDFSDGLSAFQMLAPEDRERGRANVHRVLRGEDLGGTEYKAQRRDGTTFPVIIYSTRIVRHGKAVGLRGFMVDITDRKQAEEELRQSEERLRLVVANSPDIIFQLDTDQRYTLVLNPVPPLTAEQVLGKTDFDLLPREEAQHLTEVRRKVLETGVGRRAEFRLTLGGAYRYFDAAWEPWRSSEGKIVGIIGYARDVTDRKRAEEALAEQRLLLETILTQAADAIVVCDAQGRLTFVNAAARRITGLSPDGRTLYVSQAVWGLAYAPDGRPIPPNEWSLAMALRGEVIVGREVHMVRPDGVSYDILISAAPLRSSDGTIVGAVATFADITDRKRAEDVLRESERRYRELADSLPQIVFETDTEGLLLFVNRSAFDAFGYTRADFGKGLVAYQMLVPEQRARARDEIRHVLSGEELGGREYTALRKDGTTFPVMVYSSRVVQQGRPVGLRGFIVDITERKRAEEALRQSEAKFRSLYGAVGAGIVVHGPDGAIVDANARAQEILGLRLDEMRGATSTDRRWQAIHEDGTPFPGEQHPASTALRTGERVHDVAMGVIRPTGERRWLLVNAVPIVDPSTGAILGAVATILDITDRKRAEQFRDEYLSLISHDLRNPLATVMGMADWLRRTLEQKGMAREATSAGSMLRSARRMSAMIQDLAESARLESGRLELHKEPTDLTQLVFDLAGRVGTMQDRARIQVEVPEWVPLVLADPTYLERAIVNLVTNGLKYSPPESPVTIRVERTDGEARVAVIDRGSGIPAEDIPNLFQRFYRAKAGKRAEGLGLGLYITRLIVEAHDGQVWVESEVGRGSTFYFTVPLA